MLYVNFIQQVTLNSLCFLQWQLHFNFIKSLLQNMICRGKHDESSSTSRFGKEVPNCLFAQFKWYYKSARR